MSGFAYRAGTETTGQEYAGLPRPAGASMMNSARPAGRCPSYRVIFQAAEPPTPYNVPSGATVTPAYGSAPSSFKL